MANSRWYMETAEWALEEVWRGVVPHQEIEEVLRGADYELGVAESLLKEGGDSDGPICCFREKDGKIGCGRYTEHGEFVMDIMAPLGEFVRHCKACRAILRAKLPRMRGKVARARALHNLPLEEILGDLEKLHLAQEAIEHLLVPITSNEELWAEAERILPYAQSLPYYDRGLEPRLRDLYFALGESDSSTYQGSGRIRIDRTAIGRPRAHSDLVHELHHLLKHRQERVPGAKDSEMLILGLETSALMALDGDRSYEIALYWGLKNLVSLTAYIKARWLGQMDRWKALLGKLFSGDVVDKIEELYQKGFAAEFGESATYLGSSATAFYLHYTLAPYLALKEALREGRDYIPVSDDYEKEMEISALLEILRKVLLTRG